MAEGPTALVMPHEHSVPGLLFSQIQEIRWFCRCSTTVGKRKISSLVNLICDPEFPLNRSDQGVGWPEMLAQLLARYHLHSSTR